MVADPVFPRYGATGPASPLPESTGGGDGRPSGDNTDGQPDTGCRVPAGEKACRVRRHFDAIARKYDFMNSLLSLGLHRRWKRLAVQALNLKTGEDVIDVCGGTADLSLLAGREVGSAGRVIVSDINREMITAGMPKIRRSPLEGRLFCVQGDAESLPFPGDRFDAAMVGFGVRNLTHMEKGVAEMYRVLKPGGRFMCLEFSLPEPGLFRMLYDLYSFGMIPLAGRLLAGDRAAYLHLIGSIRRFPPPERFSALLQQTGFTNVVWRRLTRGIVVIYRAVKP